MQIRILYTIYDVSYTYTRIQEIIFINYILMQFIISDTLQIYFTSRYIYIIVNVLIF